MLYSRNRRACIKHEMAKWSQLGNGTSDKSHSYKVLQFHWNLHLLPNKRPFGISVYSSSPHGSSSDKISTESSPLDLSSDGFSKSRAKFLRTQGFAWAGFASVGLESFGLGLFYWIRASIPLHFFCLTRETKATKRRDSGDLCPAFVHVLQWNSSVHSIFKLISHVSADLEKVIL